MSINPRGIEHIWDTRPGAVNPPLPLPGAPSGPLYTAPPLVVKATVTGQSSDDKRGYSVYVEGSTADEVVSALRKAEEGIKAGTAPKYRS